MICGAPPVGGAIAAAALACPFVECTDALPKTQRLVLHGDLHLPPAVLIEVGVLFIERDQGDAAIAWSRGLEQGLDISLAPGYGLLWPRATAQARGREVLHHADQFLRMVGRLAERGIARFILLVMPASIWSMWSSLGAVGVADGVAPCLSVVVAYLWPSRLRTPVLLVRELVLRHPRGLSGSNLLCRVQ